MATQWKKLVVHVPFYATVICVLISMYILYQSHPIASFNDFFYKVDDSPHICNTFNFHRAEWTLHQKAIFDEHNETQVCRSLHRAVFADNLVKWIVYPNKSTQNLGCTKNSPKCTQSAHFDNKFAIRINTPPCCRAKLLKLLEVVTIGFQKLKITHVLVMGSVIGWFRNQKFIPYDVDLDMVVDEKDWRTPRFLRFFQDISDKYGFYYYFRSDLGTMTIQYSKNNKNSLDIWPMAVLKNTGLVHIKHNEEKDKPYDVIYPPRRVNFSGISTFVPNQPRRYLDIQFGKGRWEKELTCKKKSDGKCKS